jgi:translation initiation factor IF-3
VTKGGHISTEPRINERIRVPEVRLVGPAGEQVGIVAIQDALRLAQEADLDLVEVAPMARPPVCKLMDYGKFKYESALKARESRKNQAQTVIKEIKLRPKIDPHDYGTKKGHVERFLKQGDKVKVTIMFRGREQSRPELGFKLLQKLAADVEELGFVESTPKQDGRNMIMVIGPHKRKTDAIAAARAERATRSSGRGGVSQPEPADEVGLDTAPVSSADASGPAAGSAGRTGTEQAGTEQAGTEQAGTEQAGTEQAGTEQAGTEQAGTEQAGTEQAGTEQAGTEQAGTEQAGTEQGGPEQDGTSQASTSQASTSQAAGRARPAPAAPSSAAAPRPAPSTPRPTAPRPQPRPGTAAPSGTAAPKPTAPRTAASPAGRPGAGSAGTAAPRPTAPRGTAAARAAASGSTAATARPGPVRRAADAPGPSPRAVATDRATKPSADPAPAESDSES